MTQFEPLFRVAVEEHKAKIGAMLASVGKVTDISFSGPQNGGDVFKITFEHCALPLWVQLAPNGKIAAVRAAATVASW